MNGVERVDRSDIQGLVAHGYGRLPSCCYVLLSMGDPAGARRFVAGLDITDGTAKPSQRSLNIALTFDGLARLGLDDVALAGLSVELREGMVTEHRKRQLGDHGDSDPATWAWGGGDGAPLHMLLLIFAADEAELAAHHTALQAAWTRHGLTCLGRIDSRALAGAKEHFGFRDGMAQPKIIGLHADEPGPNVIASGEFLLGRRNEYGRVAQSPMVAQPSALLPTPDGRPGRDFGRDGSYLVVRQLRQHVTRFWAFVARAVDECGFAAAFGSTPDPRIRFAAKMVGRWPGGAPLVLSPDLDDPDRALADAFGYREQDPEGMSCPFGAHIRRTNPRDWQLAETAQEADRIARRHRILRRGRAYGPPLVPGMETEKLLGADDDGQERGLVFVCLNANIGRQFEFIQHTWVQNPKFAGLYEDADPVMGDHCPDVPYPPQTPAFTVPASPVRLRATGIARFVDVRGGAYFFLPSLPALRYLSRLG